MATRAAAGGGIAEAPVARRPMVWLGAIAAVGLAVRLYYIHVHKQHVIQFSDAFYYHGGANMLAAGHGFQDPFAFYIFGLSHPGASHPPGFVVALAGASLLGFKSFFAHQVTAALISTATVIVVGLVGRRVANARVGLIAAGVAAIYPNFFFSDALLLSETLVLLMAALTLLVVYRFWERPSVGRAATLGLLCGLTALARSETVLLLGLLILPATLLLRQLDRQRRLKLFGVAAATAVLTIAPWAAYNLARFDHPVLLSLPDQTLLAGNCQETYYGPTVGYWSVACLTRGVPGKGSLTDRLMAQTGSVRGDASTSGVTYRKEAVTFIRHHLSRTPFVAFAREGRTFGFYRPAQQLRLDQLAPRELWLSKVAAGMYYVLALGAIGGVVVLRRRRVPVFPFFALLGTVVISVAVTIGETRYRALAEVPLVVCAAVAVDAAITRLSPARVRTGVGERPEAATVPHDPVEPEPAVSGAATGGV